MSGMDGITLIGEVKKLYPTIAIICISGYDEYEYLRSCLRLGAKDYLLKPIDRDKLFESVQTVISGKQVDEKDILLSSPVIDEQKEQNYYIKIVSDYIDEHRRGIDIIPVRIVELPVRRYVFLLLKGVISGRKDSIHPFSALIDIVRNALF
jgi:response regulator of citrate/malate metabolism